MQLLSSRGQNASTSRSHESFMQHQYYHIPANKDYGDEYLGQRISSKIVYSYLGSCAIRCSWFPSSNWLSERSSNFRVCRTLSGLIHWKKQTERIFKVIGQWKHYFPKYIIACTQLCTFMNVLKYIVWNLHQLLSWWCKCDRNVTLCAV